jgi:hypothetical protein
MPKVGASRSLLLPRRRCELEAMDRAGVSGKEGPRTLSVLDRKG